MVSEKSGRRPLRAIKLMNDDPVAIAERSESIKTHYVQLFALVFARFTTAQSGVLNFLASVSRFENRPQPRWAGNTPP
jgi:hypothetical protein